MNRATRLTRYGVLLVSLFCFACVSFERSYPNKRYFVIELNSAKDGNPGGGEILSMYNLHISPRYADLGFVYRMSETEYEADFYNQFLSSPAVMISEETRKALAASNKFKFVVGPASSLTAELHSGRLDQLALRRLQKTRRSRRRPGDRVFSP